MSVSKLFQKCCKKISWVFITWKSSQLLKSGQKKVWSKHFFGQKIFGQKKIRVNVDGGGG